MSRASARQRRGRAGRVAPGHCLRLFSRHTHEAVMEEHQQPEMLRVPLEGLVLQVRERGGGGVGVGEVGEVGGGGVSTSPNEAKPSDTNGG